MSELGALVLWGDRLWDSPYVFTAFVALVEKGLAFQTRDVDLDKKEQMSPSYRQRTLTARVPALEHDDFVLTESSAIVEYLDEKFAPARWPRLFPDGVRTRARARQLMSWLRSDLGALREERPTSTMFFARATAPLSAAAGAAADKLVFVAQALVPDDAGPLFGQWCIADSDLALGLQRLILNGDQVPDRLIRYASAQWNRPSVQQFVHLPRPEA